MKSWELLTGKATCMASFMPPSFMHRCSEHDQADEVNDASQLIELGKPVV
jgi:hypothetical protein